jgi:hypothetical protein
MRFRSALVFFRGTISNLESLLVPIVEEEVVYQKSYFAGNAHKRGWLRSRHLKLSIACDPSMLQDFVGEIRRKCEEYWANSDRLRLAAQKEDGGG